MTALGHDLATLTLALAIPAAVFSALPYKAFLRPPSRPATHQPCIAQFVTLSEEAERATMRTARTAWQVGTEDLRNLRADMWVWELPEPDDGPVIAAPTQSAALPPTEPYAMPAVFSPGMAAPRLPRLVAEPVRPVPTFPRTSLLELTDGFK